METELPNSYDSPLSDLTLRDLLHGLARRLGRLVSAEVDLARAEAEADLDERIHQARDGAIAGVACLIGVNLVLVALILALSTLVAPWLAALVIAAPFLVAAGVFAARFRGVPPGLPLKETRRSLGEDLELMRGAVKR